MATTPSRPPCPPRPPVAARTFTQRFSSTRRGARLARVLTAHQLHVWGYPYGSDASDTVVLVVAELAANAVLHGLVPGRDFALRLVHEEGAALVRVEVSDTHPGTPERRDPTGESVGGRGLVLVHALSARWGVRGRTGPGKTVWAEVAVAPTEPKQGRREGAWGR